ncbi:MAG: protease modulator HflC [Pseudomonadota bacterium]
MSLAKNKIILIIALLICLLFIAYNSVYTVSEGYTALLSPSITLRKANLLSTVPQEPGLHFKLPFLAQTTLIDMRLHNFTYKKLSLLTADQQALIVNYYASWHVTHPIDYLQTHNNPQETKKQLTKKINVLLQNAFSHNTRNTILGKEQASLLDTIRKQANKQLKTLGVTLVAIGFKSIAFPAEANTVVLKNIRKEQAHIALEQRAIGKANAENIRANADNQVALQLAKAKEEAAIIRGQGDASAAKIYSEAYHKNPQFAAFFLNLEAYRNGFTQSSSNNFMVLNTKDSLFNLIKGTSKTHSKDLG